MKLIISLLALSLSVPALAQESTVVLAGEVSPAFKISAETLAFPDKEYNFLCSDLSGDFIRYPKQKREVINATVANGKYNLEIPLKEGQGFCKWRTREIDIRIEKGSKTDLVQLHLKPLYMSLINDASSVECVSVKDSHNYDHLKCTVDRSPDYAFGLIKQAKPLNLNFVDLD